MRGSPCNAGSGRPRWRQGWCAGDELSCGWPRSPRNPLWRRWSASTAPSSASGRGGFSPSALRGWLMPLAAGPRAFFPPEVAIHVVRLAGERPAILGRSLSPWACHELARQRIAEAIVEDIAASTVRRILAAHHLKPWRHQLGLHPKQPREATFDATLAELIERYTRPLREDELVRSVDEKTALPPRPRPAPTLPAQPHNLPNRLAHEYKRAGALNLFVAFDPRSGQGYGPCYDRKRQEEGIAFLEHLDREMAEPIRTLHRVGANVSTHHGKEVTRWRANHPRFVVHFTPGHGSWMHPVEHWCSSLQRKRLRIVDFPPKDSRRAKLAQCIWEWNQQAPPVNWSVKSVAKVMAEAPALAA
jgi:transposase